MKLLFGPQIAREHDLISVGSSTVCALTVCDQVRQISRTVSLSSLEPSHSLRASPTLLASQARLERRRRGAIRRRGPRRRSLSLGAGRGGGDAVGTGEKAVVVLL